MLFSLNNAIFPFWGSTIGGETARTHWSAHTMANEDEYDYLFKGTPSGWAAV